MEPKAGSPCLTCIEYWLKDRNIQVKRTTFEESTPLVKKTLQELVASNTPHTFYEIMADGQKTRLDCLVFPHARCRCFKENYVPPVKMTKRTNLAFSPIFQLKCIRYGTPDSNLWFFTAVGQSPYTLKLVAASGADPDKEKARFKALDSWMKRVSFMELDHRIELGETFTTEDLETRDTQIVASKEELHSRLNLIGVGKTKEMATLDAVFSLAKLTTLKRYTSSGKNPMLIVGSNSWLRNKVPFFLLQQYDLYPLFYPNQSPAWVVGLAAFSRLNPHETPSFVFGADADINAALDQAIAKVLQVCRPANWRKPPLKGLKETQKANSSKLNLWWTHWIYRCPKISLKDVLQLEAYPKSIETWQPYLKSLGKSASVIEINSHLLPSQIKYLVKLQLTQTKSDALPHVANVRGIGTWASISKTLSGI